MDKEELGKFLLTLDRAYFIDAGSKALAHVDAALPIGYGQTISQPSLVRYMTELLDPDMDSKVLELGTGSGYQTAILAQFSKSVYTVERIPELSKKAQKRLENLEYKNIKYLIRDGSHGLPEFAPFDRIMVTAAASMIPEELVDQMTPGGRMVIPVGTRYLQELFLVTKDDEEEVTVKPIEYVIFVELAGDYGFDA
ncbi:MAG: protein-L-isoaspartate(D-aspartate) O-methyltransferase [Bacillota bacterium]|nr:protein-L-isoaspartate(D-aspartate) O-methyltransferase [Bacillota bacterium]